MTRRTACMASLTLSLLAMMLPAAAEAAGCEVVRAPPERAECAARQVARERARAQVAQATGSGVGGEEVADASPRSTAWRDALEEARGAHPGELIEPRPVAAVVGLVWFGLVLRRRLRRGRRSAR